MGDISGEVLQEIKQEKKDPLEYDPVKENEEFMDAAFEGIEQGLRDNGELRADLATSDGLVSEAIQEMKQEKKVPGAMEITKEEIEGDEDAILDGIKEAYKKPIWKKWYFQLVAILLVGFWGIERDGLASFLGGLIAIGILSRIFNKVFGKIETNKKKLLYSYTATTITTLILTMWATNYDFYFSFGYLPMIILWFLFDVFGFELK